LDTGCNMLCKKPFIKDGVAYGCGQCLPCRINKRRLWTTRMLLEAECHQDSSFITLTYAPEHEQVLRASETGLSSLFPKHVTDFLKRLRKSIAPHKIRYFLVGEYGDESWRPHYHLAIFGLPGCKYGKPKIGRKRVSYEKNGTKYWEINQCPCKSCQLVQSKWYYGFTLTGQLNKDSAQYIAGYVTKKLTNAKNEEVKEKLQGRHPEYTRMSNRPGIGALALDGIVEFLETEHGCDFMTELGDVPQTIRIAGQQRPLGRYLRSKIREKMGWKEIGTPKEVLQKLQEEGKEEFQELLQEGKTQYKILAKYDRKQAHSLLLLEKNRQKHKNLEKRFKIFKNRRQL
jgi:hypothetical protein